MKNSSSYTFEPIGHIETCFKERFGTPRQPGLVPSSWGVVQLRNELNLSDALEGLEGFSHVWLIFVFHQNTNKGIKTKVHPPRMQGEKIGLFATRTPHRPNPIGLSVVKIEKIEGNSIYLSGVDLVDGTPILDVKPYLPSADSLPQASVGWTATREERTISVEWSQDALKDLSAMVKNSKVFTEERFTDAVREILELDPRPTFYKGTDENPNPYMDVYGFRIDDFNVVYRMEGTQARVQAIEPWATRSTYQTPRKSVT